MFYGRAPILQQQPLRHGGQTSRQLMESRPQAALSNAQLGAQVPESYSLHVMLNGQVREQPVTEEALGEHSGRSSRKGAVAVLAVTLLQFVADDFLSYRVDLDNRTGVTAFGIQRATAVRTAS